MRLLKALLLALTLSMTVGAVTPVLACPMCKVANEDNEDPETKFRPQAYMYSILFMLAMPASIFTFFGVTFYRLSKQRDQLNASQSGELTAEDLSEST